MDKSAAKAIIDSLTVLYPSAECELKFSSAFELLVATILSAQCTDKRVNEVTEKLFKEFNKPEDFASLSYEDLEKRIYSCGFYRSKSKNIIDCSRELLIKHNGAVPSTMEELVALPGVGRKTANVVLSNAFNQNTIAVDTHVYRVSKRLQMSNGKTPYDVEKDLINILDEADRSKAHHLLIFHGRYCCHSRSPECKRCPLTRLCGYYSEING